MATNNLRREPKRKPVTLIVGIVCRDAVVLASDSQTTNLGSETKRKDSKKIHAVHFANGSVLVAESGAVHASGAVLDILSAKARTATIADERTVPALVEESIRELRQKRLSLFPSHPRPLEEIQDFFRGDEDYFELMFAFHLGSGVHLYTANPAWGLPIQVTKPFDAAGSGATLGMYLLGELYQPEMSAEFACSVAVRVVEAVKQYDLYCEGPTQLGIIKAPQDLVGRWPNSSAEGLTAIFEREQVKELEKIVGEIDLQTKEERNRLVRERLQEKTKSYVEDLFIKHNFYLRK
jgi:20S proteasome alpha/beta subunit